MCRFDGLSGRRIAVLIPCYNEELTIDKVVADFKRALPKAEIYVYDNNSKDATARVASAAGAFVRRETRQGKGQVVRRMFSDIDADIYVLVDGDDTYDAEAVPSFIKRLLTDRLDFVNGARLSDSSDAYRRGHRLGNIVLNKIVSDIFGRQFDDMLSGYKVFTHQFVKSFPAMSQGFEIETELVVHALELRMACSEEGTVYRERPAGSSSKLKTFRDGVRILIVIANLIRNERPFQFFSCVALFFALVGAGIAIPVFLTYFETGLVPRLPTAVLSTGLAIIATLCFFTGLILDTVTTMRQEVKRLAYLSIPWERKADDEC